MSDAPARRRARRLGLRAETVALLWLAAKGYRPLARRYGGKGGEIDLVVVRGGTVSFVEVKARAGRAEAAEAITPAKQRLVSRAARRWLAQNPWAVTRTLRADAVLITPGHLPEHLPDAFELRVD